jgi:hypothetical protein
LPDIKALPSAFKASARFLSSAEGPVDLGADELEAAGAEVAVEEADDAALALVCR